MNEHDEHEETIESHADEGYFDLLTDPAHFMGELTYEAIFFILGALWLRFKLRKRDKEHEHVLQG